MRTDTVRLALEDFEIICAAVNLWGAAKHALRLVLVDGVPEGEVAAALGVDAEIADLLLQDAREAFGRHQWPATALQEARMLLEVGFRRPMSSPPAPNYVRNPYTEQFEVSRIRGPVVIAEDLVRTGRRKGAM